MYGLVLCCEGCPASGRFMVDPAGPGWLVSNFLLASPTARSFLPPDSTHTHTTRSDKQSWRMAALLPEKAQDASLLVRMIFSAPC